MLNSFFQYLMAKTFVFLMRNGLFFHWLRNMNIVIYFLTRNVKLFFRKTFSLKETLRNVKPFLRQTISDIQNHCLIIHNNRKIAKASIHNIKSLINFTLKILLSKAPYVHCAEDFTQYYYAGRLENFASSELAHIFYRII